MQDEKIEATATTVAQENEEADCVADAVEIAGGKTYTAADSEIERACGAESGIMSEELLRALGDREVRERFIFGNEEICNEVIRRYLDELATPKSVPIVRGFSALSPLPRPRSLMEAKAIVDKGKLK